MLEGGQEASNPTPQRMQSWFHARHPRLALGKDWQGGLIIRWSRHDSSSRHHGRRATAGWGGETGRSMAPEMSTDGRWMKFPTTDPAGFLGRSRSGKAPG